MGVPPSLSSTPGNYRYDFRVSSDKWDKVKVKRWMQQHVNDHVDHQTDEVNSTGLAEEAANEFDIYEDKRDYKIPEEVYDMAVDVGDEWEKRHRKAAASISKGKKIKSEGVTLTVTDVLDDDWVVAQNPEDHYVVVNHNGRTNKWDSLEWSSARSEALEKARERMKKQREQDKHKVYSYDRRADSNFGAYVNRLEALQSTFATEVAQKVTEYIETLHRRLSARPPFDSISSFLSWDYGGTKQLGANKWQVHVWQKDQSRYPEDIEPNLFVTLEFGNDGKVSFEVKAGSDKLLSKTVSQTSSSSSSIGMSVGEAWEKKLTGTVEYE